MGNRARREPKVSLSRETSGWTNQPLLSCYRGKTDTNNCWLKPRVITAWDIQRSRLHRRSVWRNIHFLPCDETTASRSQIRRFCTNPLFCKLLKHRAEHTFALLATLSHAGPSTERVWKPAEKIQKKAWRPNGGRTCARQSCCREQTRCVPSSYPCFAAWPPFIFVDIEMKKQSQTHAESPGRKNSAGVSSQNCFYP